MDDSQESDDEEDEAPYKIRKFPHAWDILRSNLLWNIWVERYRVVMGEKTWSAHSILLCAWRDTISAGIALYAELHKFANKRSLEAQATLVYEFWRAWVGYFCFENASLRWQFTPLDCLYLGGQF